MGFCQSQCGICVHESAGHEQQPHFHLCTVGLCQHACKNHHADLASKPKGHKEQVLGEQTPVEDHDHDAVYLSAQMMLGWHSSHAHVAAEYDSMLRPVDAMLAHPCAPAIAPWWANPLFSLPCHDCPLYLRTLALLI
jgi:hypothetical protein